MFRQFAPKLYYLFMPEQQWQWDVHLHGVGLHSEYPRLYVSL